MLKLPQRSTTAFAGNRLTLAVLVALAPALSALAAENPPSVNSGNTGTASTAEPPVLLAAAEQIDIFGRSQSTVRELPTLRGPVIDIPQQITTISADTLKDRQVTSLEDALRNVAGVTTQIGEGGTMNGDQFFIRGQAAKNDIFTDGLRDFGAFTRDSFNYENIAVLKGPSSTALGRGVTGGAINSGSKLPTTENFQTVSGSLGTASYHRAQYDGNHALSATSGIRLNVMVHENNVVDRDVINSDRWGIAPSIGFGIGTDTSVNVIYFHQHENRVPDYGVPVITTTAADDIELPVTEYGVRAKNFYGYDADNDKVNVDTLTMLFNHNFSENLTLSSASKVGRYSRYFRQTVASCPAATCGNLLIDNNPATVPLASMGGPGPYDQQTKGIQNVTAILFTQPVGSLRNEFAVGFDVSRQTNERLQYNYLGTRASKDLFAPLHTPEPLLATGLNNLRNNTATDYSLFIDDRLWLNDQFSLGAGARIQRFNTQQDQLSYPAVGATTLTSCDGRAGAYATCFFSREAENDLVNPKLSAVWEPSEAASVYVSYSRSAIPPGNSVGNGDALSALGTGASITTASLDPEESSTIDLGLKMSFFKNKLLLQTGVYQTDRANAQETDPQSGVLIVSSEPKQRLRGIELGVSGAVNESLLLTANYSHIKAEIISAFTGTPPVPDLASIGRQVRYVPEDSASAWATWKPVRNQDWLQHLELGAGLSYQSKVYLNLQNTQETPAYTSFDALVAYTLKDVRISLNVYNLTNEFYYSQVNGGRVVPAAGRSFIASAQYSF